MSASDPHPSPQARHLSHAPVPNTIPNTIIKDEHANWVWTGTPMSSALAAGLLKKYASLLYWLARGTALHVIKLGEQKKIGVVADETKEEKSISVVVLDGSAKMEKTDSDKVARVLPVLEEDVETVKVSKDMLTSASMDDDEVNVAAKSVEEAGGKSTERVEEIVLSRIVDINLKEKHDGNAEVLAETDQQKRISNNAIDKPILAPLTARKFTAKRTITLARKSPEAIGTIDYTSLRAQTSKVATTALTKLHTTFGSQNAISGYLNDRLLIAANAWAFFMMDLAALLNSAAMAWLFTLPAPYALGDTPVSKAFCQGQGDPLDILYKLLFGVFWMVFLEFWILVVESRLVGFEWKMLIRKMEKAPIAINVFACFWMMSLSALSVILLVEGGMYGSNWGCYARGRI
ncbi:hypothetical protein HDV05_007921 [Chytridiales sp. JEL 0842]|nr:hypothetical protein HDV05_007921 [Chytridiales sp. JEL 0842]